MGDEPRAKSLIYACRRTIGSCSLAVATGATFVFLLTAILLATEYLPAEATRENLQRSFESGALQDNDWPGKDRVRGANQYNDCLLVMMTRFRASRVESAVAPTIIFSDYPVNLDTSECAIAHKAVFSDAPRTLFDQQSYFPYGRYVHAYRIPFNALIVFFPVDFIRHLYRLVGILILAGAIMAHLVRLAVAFRTNRFRAAATSGAFVTVGIALTAFSGLDLFGQSLTHGPSDILLFGTFAALSLGSMPSGHRRVVVIAALGSLAFAFDFLHGTIPMMLAIILGCTALRAFAARENLTVMATARVSSIYLVGIAASLAAKLASLWAILGTDGLWGYYWQLRLRIDGGDHSLTEIARLLDAAMPNIAWDSRTLATVALVGSTICAATAFFLVTWRKFPARDRGAVIMGLASIGVILCWYAIFRNHSAMHATFMVRLLAWPIAIAPASLILAGAALFDAGVLRVRMPAFRPGIGQRSDLPMPE